MRTLFLNPPSFEGFDGGAGSRWPSTREIESYWYPVWLCYPAGMLEDSKVLDAPPHGVSIEETVAQAKNFELMVLFTSSPGFHVDVKIAEMMKDSNPKLKVAFVGPPVTIEPDKVLNASKAIDFIARREFDYPIANYAKGAALEDLAGVSFRKNGVNVHNPEGGYIENLDELPWVTKVYKRDLDFRRYNVPFLLNPYVSFYTTRGCPAMCTFCLWPQTHSGHRWRLRSSQDIANECRYVLENFPGLKEIFFDDDTFNYRKARTLELCAELKKLNFTWSCTSRVTTDYETLKAMKEAGCRLLIVGYESGDEQILRNIKKGATIDMAKRFTENCHKLGLVIHGDFIVGLPGETRETLRNTIDFAKRLDVETIQVSIAHAFPGTEFYDYAKKNNLVQINMADDEGHQLPNVVYPGILEREELVDWVERFYGEYYFRPKAAWRIVRKAIFDGHERKRLYKEAKDYLYLRNKRKKYVAAHRATRVLNQEQAG
ncbi:MAG TPA: hopanoid biosynthesis associated radical SAM protein HpnJ [Bryobacteraceae bacterium]|jgi:hopanoid biosynthesis associated radical SAM protein HpnJ|nr:hopanoid biosynthesis associated radical SAM protein HpnJ [Bryobacteraceae bacterium]